MLLKPQVLRNLLPKTNGLFAHMSYNFRAEVSKDELDLLLRSNYGRKNPSPIVEEIQTERGEPLTNADLTTLASIIVSMYKEKWDKLGEIYDLEYDPIHNYLDDWSDEAESNGTRTETSELSRTDTYGHQVADESLRTDNLSQRTLGTIEHDTTRTDNLTSVTDETVTTDGTDDNLHSVYGFNSSTANPESSDHDDRDETVETDGTYTNTGTVRNQGTDDTDTTVTNTGTRDIDRTIVNSGTDQRSDETEVTESNDNTRERSGVHRGNIGNITTQKMIEEEIRLWRWNYMQAIIDDVKDFCALPIYLNPDHWIEVD